MTTAFCFLTISFRSNCEPNGVISHPLRIDSSRSHRRHLSSSWRRPAVPHFESSLSLGNNRTTATNISTTPTQQSPQQLDQKDAQKNNLTIKQTTPTLRQQKQPTTIRSLKHVAFICDGNSRYASNRHLPSFYGHMVGANNLLSLLPLLVEEWNVEYATFYVFSTENWNRSNDEIRHIWQVIERTVSKIRISWNELKYRIRIIGNWNDERIPNTVRTSLRNLEQTSSTFLQEEEDDRLLTVCLAINYGGRADLVQAMQKLHLVSTTSTISITEEEIGKYLSTSGIPDPDLIIRTGGECRLSNFLLWNAAYAEIYFSNVLWPEFDKECLSTAIHWFMNRERRFGGRL